jgi:hypothetical protein
MATRRSVAAGTGQRRATFLCAVGSNPTPRTVQLSQPPIHDIDRPINCLNRLDLNFSKYYVCLRPEQPNKSSW